MQLENISQIQEQKERQEAYLKYFRSLLDKRDVEACKDYVKHILSDTVPLVLGRPLFQDFVAQAQQVQNLDRKELIQFALKSVQTRSASFDEQIWSLREQLAALHEKDEEWSQAAQVLSGIDLDSGMRYLSEEDKVSMFIRICMLYLEDDNAVDAETYLNKAAVLIGGSQNKGLGLQYEVCSARILDAKRKFLEAAQRYYGLSTTQHKEISISEGDMVKALQSAIVCTILANAGPQRNRMLATLYKDERSVQMPQFQFLEKMFMGRMIDQAEVKQFQQLLKEHQQAVLSDGSTVLESAVLQHNLLSASQLYHNIQIKELGMLLGVHAEKAEQLTADMMAEGRLQGYVDQIDQMITFERDQPLSQWDTAIQDVCQLTNDIVDQILKKGLVAVNDQI
eukprot:TRINITY_DN6945_c0_g1_i1.p1 TRINITY_DN6945_c0_g1~~TRINITY_DN6945_c0_g1_i1.p1  ORF type:complete len:395 (+),score=46.06 TRINITY_DN6945_c0_g1_i1:1085-2269(+)